jgi:hypothetical protein
MERPDASEAHPSTTPQVDGGAAPDTEGQVDAPIHPLWEFIEAVLDGEMELSELTRTRADRILKGGDRVPMPPADVLTRWASEDPQLEATRELLLHAERLGGPPAICRALVELSREFTVRNVRLDGTPLKSVKSVVRLPTDEFLDLLEEFINPSIGAGRSSGGESPSRRVVARVLLHLHAIDKKLRHSELVGPLNRLFWAAAARGSLMPSKRAAIFGAGSDLSLGAATEAFDVLVTELEATRQGDLDVLARERSRTRALEEELELERSHVRILESQAKHTEADVAALEEKLRQAEQRTSQTRAHASSDFEDLRARVERQLQDQRQLLEVLTTALERDPPKVAIASERAAELIEQIDRMLDEMRRTP